MGCKVHISQILWYLFLEKCHSRILCTDGMQSPIYLCQRARGPCHWIYLMFGQSAIVDIKVPM
jgi:hypothetical protein